MTERKAFGDSAHVILFDIRSTTQTTTALRAFTGKQVALTLTVALHLARGGYLEPLRNRLARLVNNFLGRHETSSVFLPKRARRIVITHSGCKRFLDKKRRNRRSPNIS